MKSEWKAFLKSKGAEFSNGQVDNYGNAQRELRMSLTGNVFADLSHHGLIAAYGDDTQSFLQGQFSNDITHIDENHSQLSSYNNPKGRMLANFRAFQHGNTTYLRLPETLVESTIKRLRMFIMMAKVSVEDAGETFVRLGVSGPDAAKELTSALGPAPGEIDEATRSGDCAILRVPGVQPRFEVYGPLNAMTKLWDALNVHCAPVGAAPWGLLEIEAGIPTIYPETAEAFVAQMINYQLIGGVNFKKGCYPGQEVVARMQYLGSLKRRMYSAKIPTDKPPQPGDELFSPQSASGQGAGRIVDAQPHPDGGYAVLAVVVIKAADEGEVMLKDASGPRLKFNDLPYPLEDQAS